MTDPQNIQLPKKPFPFVLHFIKPFKWMVTVIALFEAGQATCQILMPYAIRRIIDRVSSLAELGDESAMMAAIQQPILLFVGLSLGILIFSRASGTILIYVAPSLRKKVRQQLYAFLQGHSHRYFTSNFSGSLANRISEVAMGVNHSLWTVLFDFWPVLISFSLSLVLLFQTHFQLGLYLGIWVSLYVVVSFVLASRCRKYASRFAEARSQVSGKIVDSVTNILNTKMFARLGFERGYLDRYLDNEITKARETFWFMEKMRWFQFTSALVLQVGMMWLAFGYWVDGSITVGSFAMVTSLSLLIINDARGLSRRFLEFFEYLGNITDGVGIMIKDHEIVDRPDAGRLEVQKGEIRYESVDFKYAQGQEVEVDLEFMGLKFFKVKACVKWLAEDHDRLNMKVMGLEFEDPKRQVLRNWKKHNMNRFLEPMDAPAEKPTKAKQKTYQLPLLHIAEKHITGILLASFLISMAF